MIARSKSRIVALSVGILIVVGLCVQYVRFSGLLSEFSGLLEAHLRSAACLGNTGKVKRLVMLGVNVNATGDDGDSALIAVEACKADVVTSRVELVELLITQGAAVNLRNNEGRTALMYAATNGDAPAVNALLRSGASVNIADNNGETAVIKAATNSCNEETVKALLSAGADLNARDHKGRNALDRFRASYACPESRVGHLLQEAVTRKADDPSRSIQFNPSK
jgi:ankyrin repeat protein